MAQPAKPAPKPKVRGGAEVEDVAYLQRTALTAANAFRDYLLTGNPAKYQEFRKLYEGKYGDMPLRENAVFMNALFKELDRIRGEPEIKPLAEAFKKDSGRLFGILWRNPHPFDAFIKRVYEIRTALERSAAKESEINRLIRDARNLKEAAKPD
jgi:hypothetical protein